MKAIGLALVIDAPRLRDAVLEVDVVRVGARGPVAAARAAVELARRWLQVHQVDQVQVAVERPGGGARADYGPRSQAEAAEGPAWVGGLVAMGLAMELGLGDPVRFRAWEWRQTMLARAAQEGLELSRPAKRPVSQLEVAGAGQRVPAAPDGENPWEAARRVQRAPKVTRRGLAFVLAYPCGHQVERPNLDSVQLTLRDVGCPSCREGRAVQPKVQASSAGKERTGEWKAQAWRFVHHARPDLAERLLGDARGRARGDREPWRHVGVADGCEAVGVGVHGHQQGPDPGRHPVWLGSQ